MYEIPKRTDDNLKELLENADISVSSIDGSLRYKIDSDPLLNSTVNFFGAGLFLLDLEMETILWGNQNFLTLNGLKKEYLLNPILKDLIYRKIHPKDINYLISKGVKNALKNDIAPFSNTLRFREKDQSWNHFYFSLISPKNCTLNKKQFKIGIQFDLSRILNHYPLMESIRDNSCYNDHEDFQKLKSLSKREKEILGLIVKGFTDKKIANQLSISNYTSEKHRKNIIQKLDVKNTASLSFLAGKYGFF
ncbi:helix-turn-helix domain-containing protein [Labilibaculum antarcticum]|uniref:HTH luxR-type domain-containing protein n=1 Tax=Labilibaculum antarcticum TaxID=1717717 RepID=A0A1Y1CRV4_9BACT|nr:LuxR C-terminal-related transcriptional regulator [Labilibaculum antarcticum]BAX82662.1 hypothetical protein ALGA_4372 [Labilibaculum antarcticum]